MDLFYSPLARRDLDEIRDYISNDLKRDYLALLGAQ